MHVQIHNHNQTMLSQDSIIHHKISLILKAVFKQSFSPNYHIHSECYFGVLLIIMSKFRKL